jgi:predicted nucleic acid-binding Zn ribbon protein
MAQKKSPPQRRKLTATQIIFYTMCVLIVASMVLSMLAK